MHQVLVGLPQRVGGLANLFYFSSFLGHAPGARRAAPRVGGLAILFYFHFILVDFYDTHQVLGGLHVGVGDLAI
jgi:hypothetical protein